MAGKFSAGKMDEEMVLCGGNPIHKVNKIVNMPQPFFVQRHAIYSETETMPKQHLRKRYTQNLQMDAEGPPLQAVLPLKMLRMERFGRPALGPQTLAQIFMVFSSAFYSVSDVF